MPSWPVTSGWPLPTCWCPRQVPLAPAAPTLGRSRLSLTPSFSSSPPPAKKKNKKGKTLTLTDFLAEDGGGGGGPTYIPKPVSWADETDDLEGDGTALPGPPGEARPAPGSNSSAAGSLRGSRDMVAVCPSPFTTAAVGTEGSPWWGGGVGGGDDSAVSGRPLEGALSRPGPMVGV